MMDPNGRAGSISLLLIRLGLGVVFVMFGYDKLPHPEHWVIYLPFKVSRMFPGPLDDFLKLQGIVEILLGTALTLGVMTRVLAGLASVILALIVYLLWPDPVAVRDLGLFFASLALILSGPGRWSLDQLLEGDR